MPAELREPADSGKLAPVIDRTYPLGEAPEAVRYLGEEHARGKVVVTAWPGRPRRTGAPR
ncbi:zinc-binding dehydrogenase [Streptomyces sp. NPDC001340]